MLYAIMCSVRIPADGQRNICPGKDLKMIYDLQKASMWKRISAWLFDVIILSVVVVLFGWLLSTALGYDGYNNTLNARYAAYGEEYGVNFDLSLSDYEALDAAGRARLDEAYAALAADETAVYAYNMVINLTLVIVTFAILLGYAVLEFTIPMALGNGQTLGKKIFSLGVMKQEGIRINGVTMFVRTFLGKFAIETMIPVLILLMLLFNSIGIVGLIVLALILLLQLGLLIATPTHGVIHDFLAQTVTVDLPSQLIFNTREEMIAYKQKVHEEKVARSPY